MKQDGGREGGDKWSDSGYILKKQLIRFPDRMKMRGACKSTVKDHSQVHGTKNWEERIAITFGWEILPVEKVYRGRWGSSILDS